MRRWLLWGLVLLVLSGTASRPTRAMPAPGVPEEGPDIQAIGTTPTPPPKLTGRWIEVSLLEQIVRLHDGQQVIGEYLAATGVGDTPDTTTYPGLFSVYQKHEGPMYLRAYGVYVTHWVGFDPEHDNGFHSLPMDAKGRVVDTRLGQPVSHGCIRLIFPETVFRFATFGMQVWIH